MIRGGMGESILPLMEKAGGNGSTTLVSVIVPLSERPESPERLYNEYSRALRGCGVPVEFIFVVQPWYRELASPLLELAATGEPVRVVRPGQGAPAATLVKLGLAEARGEVIVTLPAYFRIESPCIVELLRELDSDTDLVVARRWPRRDSWVNRLQTRAFHTLIGRIADGRVHDIACGVGVMRRELLEQVPLYGDFYRFFPLLAMREGYTVKEVACPQHPDDVPTRVYSPGIYLRRLIDIIGLFFLLRFTEKPLRFFGLLGSVLSASGTLLLAVLLVERLMGQGIADRPLLLLGVLLVVLGVQVFAMGLIGEIIVHLQADKRRGYRLARRPEE